MRLIRQHVETGTLTEDEGRAFLDGRSPYAAQGKIAERFPTPTVKGNHNRKGLTATSGNGLATVARNYPTPLAHDAGRGDPYASPRKDQRNFHSLNDAISARYPTPNARDHKGASHNTPLRDSLDFAAERGATRAQTYPHDRPPQYRLNPLFVEWLMGWPNDCPVIRPLQTLTWPDWTGEHPHPLAPRAENFTARITALGNGQVPQCAAAAWTALTQWLNDAGSEP